MPFNTRPIDDLIAIAASGGGLRINAMGIKTDDLAAIADAAKRGGATVIFAGMFLRSLNDLRQIGAPGKGAVIFED